MIKKPTKENCKMILDQLDRDIRLHSVNQRGTKYDQDKLVKMKSQQDLVTKQLYEADK